MPDKFRAVYYINQFFGQIGGEESAYAPVLVKDEKIGPASAFDTLLVGEGEVVRTIICGDNYFNENKDKTISEILSAVEAAAPSVLVAGPAFNAGRYGTACAEIIKAVTRELKIPAVSGMYTENPGVALCREAAYIVSTGESAGGMREALLKMAALAKKLAAGDEIGPPEETGYIPRGIRKTVFVQKRGSRRAVDMLLAILCGEAYQTEMEMPVFDTVSPARPIADLTNATIALCSSGGIVPLGNPDRIESASAQKWARYDISGKKSLGADFYSTHGGYDPVYANEMPDRIVPVDILNEFKNEGIIGGVHPYFYSTTGTGTAVGKAAEFGAEIGARLKNAGVDGVILTST